LSALPPIDDPSVLVGTSTADDAAVYRVSDELAIIQTVDFFTPIVDSPYYFGAISAANSISDVYAMGGKPVMALNVVGFPKNREGLPLSVLGEVLEGGADKAREANVAVVGGHTIDDHEPKYGMSVMGFVHPERIWKNIGGKPGDALVLTKPIGTGIISTAMRAGKASDEVGELAIRSMAMLNRAAADAASAFEVHACTDITGFGLLGHLREMLSDGTVGARVEAEAVPLLAGTRELCRAGFVPGGTRRNLAALGAQVRPGALPEEERLILADAQTSGGLLLALPRAVAKELLDELERAGVMGALIGELVEEHPGIIDLR